MPMLRWLDVLIINTTCFIKSRDFSSPKRAQHCILRKCTSSKGLGNISERNLPVNISHTGAWLHSYKDQKATNHGKVDILIQKKKMKRLANSGCHNETSP